MRNSRMCALLILFFAAALSAPAEQAAQPRTIDRAPARVGVSITEHRLTLREAVEMALKNNLDIEIERTNRAGAQESAKGALGLFDTALSWSSFADSRNTPVGSVLQGADGKLKETRFSQTFTLRQRIPGRGSLLRMDFDSGRQTTTNPFLALNPLFTSSLVFSFTQPLLRNRETDRERTELRVRRKQVDVSDVDFELRVTAVLTSVEQSYWDLVAARQDMEVKADGVEWAREQLARNRRMIEAGSLAPVELAAAEAELERRLDTWYASVGQLTEVENQLKVLIAPDRTAEIWGERLSPAEQATLEPPNVDDLRQAMSEALQRRPELRHVDLRLEVNDIQKKYNADQTKPQLNLVASYINSGIGGAISDQPNPFTASNAVLYDRLNTLLAQSGIAPVPLPNLSGLPPGLVGGYGTSLSNVFSGRYQTFQGGLQLDLNLRNRTAESNMAQTVIGERRLKLERTRLEQAIEAQVRNAMQALQTSRQRIAAAEASARAAREKLESETRLFQTGESTNFLVLTRQNEYLDSRRRVVVANLEFNRAVARLQNALGATLSAHNVSLQ